MGQLLCHVDRFFIPWSVDLEAHAARILEIPVPYLLVVAASNCVGCRLAVKELGVLAAGDEDGTACVLALTRLTYQLESISRRV